MIRILFFSSKRISLLCIRKIFLIVMKKILHWVPRILAILFIMFISVFALDVFKEPQWFFALLIHLIPSFILIALTAIAWKHEQIGGNLFAAVGFFSIFFFHGQSIIISLPIIVIGLTFIGSDYLSRQKNAPASPSPKTPEGPSR